MRSRYSIIAPGQAAAAGILLATTAQSSAGEQTMRGWCSQPGPLGGGQQVRAGFASGERSSNQQAGAQQQNALEGFSHVCLFSRQARLIEIGFFIKKIVSPNPLSGKILTGKPVFTGKISAL